MTSARSIRSASGAAGAAVDHHRLILPDSRGAQVAQQPSLIGAAAQFGPRFNVVSFLPNAALLGLVLVLVASGAPSEAPNLADLKEALKGWSPLAVTGALLGVVVLSLLLHPFQLALVRLLEGYWASSAPGRPLAAIGIELHRRRYERLRSAYSRAFDESNSVPDEPPTAEWTPDAGVAEDPNRLLMLARWREARHGAARADIVVHDALDRMNDYPARDRLLPTRLGNALRAGEDEAGDRYGLATNTMFPRLYPILSDRFGRLMDDARDQLDMTRQQPSWPPTFAGSSSQLAPPYSPGWPTGPPSAPLAPMASP
jgi:hypothetical protein